MSAIQINFAGISSVIASDCQRREELGAFFSIQPELVEGVELYPVDVHDAGRSTADETFIFSIYSYVEVTYRFVSRVP